MMLVTLPVQKQVFDGRVIAVKDHCVLLRDDENHEQWFCDVEAKQGDRLRLTRYSSLTNLNQLNKAEFQDVTVLSESTEHLIELLNAMTLEEKLGQMLIVRTPENLAKEMDFVPGGYILFANDFKGKNEEEIQKMTELLQKQPYGALLMVDEEGGDVVRISSVLYEEGYPSAQQLYLQGGWTAVENNLIEKSELLKTLGFQVNLNPVADVSTNPQDYIYSRAFGQNAELTSEYVSLAVRLQKEANLLSCLKHFPGYAGNKDTHQGFSVDARSLDEYRDSDFLPFLSGIQEGAELIMMSHVMMSCVDENAPASLSEKVHELLENELEYDGLTMTDDLTMDAIEQFTLDPLVAALQAGNDLLLTTDPDISLKTLIEAAENGELSLNQIDESVLKILKIKENLGILDKSS